MDNLTLCKKQTDDFFWKWLRKFPKDILNIMKPQVENDLLWFYEIPLRQKIHREIHFNNYKLVNPNLNDYEKYFQDVFPKLTWVSLIKLMGILQDNGKTSYFWYNKKTGAVRCTTSFHDETYIMLPNTMINNDELLHSKGWLIDILDFIFYYRKKKNGAFFLYHPECKYGLLYNILCLEINNFYDPIISSKKGMFFMKNN